MVNYKRFIDELDRSITDALFPGWRGKVWYWWYMHWTRRMRIKRTF